MRILTTLDPVLSGLCVLLAVGSLYTVLELMSRLRGGDLLHQKRWEALGTIALGLGIWACQFTGLQALEGPPGGPAVDLSAEVYDGRLATLALLLALFGARLVIAVFTRVGESTRGALLCAASFLVSDGIVHAVAEASMRLPTSTGFNRPVFVVCQLLAFICYTVAFRLALTGRAWVGAWNPGKLLSATLMAGALAGTNLALIQATTYEIRGTGGATAWLVKISDMSGAAVVAGTLVIMFLAVMKSFDERRLEDAAEVARQREDVERLRELDRLKQDFLSAASHELRTPLTSIMGYTEFLEDELGGPLTAEQRGYVEQVSLGAHRLQGLVDDLLDFARLEAGTFRIETAEIDLCALIDQEVESLHPQALAANITLDQAFPPTPVLLVLDPQRIGQVVLNLVNNAIKFSRPASSVHVSVTAFGDHVRVEVKDTGIGIAPEHMGHLFQKFFQVDPSLTRTHGGAGLGLAISKAIVEAHCGKIGATSELGLGSTFFFELPKHDPACALARCAFCGKPSVMYT